MNNTTWSVRTNEFPAIKDHRGRRFGAVRRYTLVATEGGRSFDVAAYECSLKKPYSGKQFMNRLIRDRVELAEALERRRLVGGDAEVHVEVCETQYDANLRGVNASRIQTYDHINGRSVVRIVSDPV